MLKTTEQLRQNYEKKLLSTRKRILRDFNKLDYIKMEKLIADVIRYNSLLGLTRRTERKQKQQSALSVEKVNLFGCSHSCSPIDFCEGGKCDKIGCYEKEVKND